MIMIKKRNILFIVLSLVVLFIGLGNLNCMASDEEVFHWRVTGLSSEGLPRQEACEYFGEIVEKASGGRLTIDVFPAGVLYDTFDALESVKNGVTEATITSSDYWAGKDIMLKLFVYRPADPFESPFEFNYLVRKTEDLVRNSYKKLGVTYVTSMVGIPGEALLSNVPIRTLEDFKGLKIRSSGLGQELYQALGASVITMPMSEAYLAMKLGTLDAFEAGGYGDDWFNGYGEVVKYAIEPPPHVMGYILAGDLVVNNESWNELPDDLKEIVRYCAEVTRLHSFTELTIFDKIGRENFIDAGIEFITLPEEDVKKSLVVASGILRDYREKSPECDMYLNIYSDVLTELGYTELVEYLK